MQFDEQGNATLVSDVTLSTDSTHLIESFMAFVQLHSLAYPPVGRWLKAQRNVLGYTLAQASDQVQMSESTLQLLECECFLDLPEPVFIKGYLRRYANQLKLDPQEVIALFDA